jgi:hypothetical protein
MTSISDTEQLSLSRLHTIRRRSFFGILFVLFLISLLALGLTQDVENLLIPLLVINGLLLLFAVVLAIIFRRFATGTLRQQRIVSWLRDVYSSLVLAALGVVFAFQSVSILWRASPLVANMITGLFAGTALVSLIVAFIKPNAMRKSFIGVETEQQRTPEQNTRVYGRFAAAIAIVFFVSLIAGFFLISPAVIPDSLGVVALVGGFGGWMLIVIGFFWMGLVLHVLHLWLTDTPL